MALVKLGFLVRRGSVCFDGSGWATPRVSVSARPRPQPAFGEVVVKAAWFG